MAIKTNIRTVAKSKSTGLNNHTNSLFLIVFSIMFISVNFTGSKDPVVLCLKGKISRDHQHMKCDLSFDYQIYILNYKVNMELRSSIYILKNHGDKMPPCLTPLSTVKLDDTTEPHLTRTCCDLYQ